MAKLEVTKIVPKDLGDPKKALALMPEKDNEVVLGTIIGLAAGVYKNTRKAQDGMTDVVTKGLAGTFEAIPADPTKDIRISGICYLPEAFLQRIFTVLEAKDYDGHPVQIAAELVVVRATNPQGYSWGMRAIGELVQVDPLANLRAMMKPAVPAITDQSGEGATDAEKTVGKGKAKQPA